MKAFLDRFAVVAHNLLTEDTERSQVDVLTAEDDNILQERLNILNEINYGSDGTVNIDGYD